MELHMDKTLGMTAKLVFGAFGNRPVEGKVDTGATVSSLHAVKMSIDKERNMVTFSCPPLSDNMISLQLDGSQEVHSADAGGVTRPVVTLDVEIDGTPVKGASFNLNDRSEMDSPVLIGQNILKTGGFVIDPNAGKAEPGPAAADSMTREMAVLAAIEMLAESNVTLGELIQYLNTAAVNRIKD
jgi:hypothetical protein